MNAQTAIVLLKDARIRIESGSEIWICYALDEAFDDVEANPDLPDAEETCDRLRNYIERQIDYRSFLTTWLMFQLGLDEMPHNDLGHLCRLAWIDRMIVELEANGCLP